MNKKYVFCPCDPDISVKKSIPTFLPCDIELLYPEILSLLFRVSDLHTRFLLTFSDIYQLFYHVEHSLQIRQDWKYWIKYLCISTLMRTQTSYCNLPIMNSMLTCNSVMFYFMNNVIFWYPTESGIYQIWNMIRARNALSYLVKCTSC